MELWRRIVKFWQTAALAGAALVLAKPAVAAAEEAVARGAYVFKAAGCLGCHTDAKGGGAPLAGGRALKTPFGTFYSPNITPDPQHGIGRWSLEDFVRAMRHGRGPDGTRYFPVFPYPSFTGMTDADLTDLKAYLDAQPAVPQANRDHEIRFPFGIRLSMLPWNWLYLTSGAYEPDPARDEQWNRGAYLVRHLSHCGECHTPRNWMGAIDGARELAGTRDGPEGGAVPNITPHPTGIGDWSDGDLDFLFTIGLLPDGDIVGGGMAEVVENSTGALTEADRAAIVAYLRAVPAVENVVSTKD